MVISKAFLQIGFDGSRAFIDNKTGTENYSYQLLFNLSKIDKKNQYIVYVRRQTEESFAYLRPGQIPGKWPVNFRFVTLNWPRLWTQGGLSLQTFKDNLDVLFVSAHTLPIIYKPGLKTVMTIHDLGSEYLPQAHQLKQRLYLKWISKFQINSAARLIAVSKSTKDDLVKKIGCNPGKIKVVYEGYDEKLFKPIKNDLLINSLKQYDLVPDKYFLFVGTVQPRKNLVRLIRAFGGVKGKSLVIAGGKGWMSDEIYKLPKKLGIEDRIKFLGRVPNEDLPALYSGAIALTFTSLFEGFGLPIIEAQACGCPVITSNISSMKEIAGGSAILIDPYDIDSISDGITKIMNNGLRSRVKELGLYNIKRFSWEKCAGETLKVLTEVGNV